MSPDVFFREEAIASLDAMDAGLADVGTADDPDAVHAVFRHAHSIKGGAAALGLEPLAELMHMIESVLDVSRTSGVPPEAASARLLRDAVDAARQMLADDGGADRTRVQQVITRLRERVLLPDTPQRGRLRRITVRSVETNMVSAAVAGLFTDIAGLGELLSVDSGAGDELVFLIRSLARDHELLDLLAMHVERANVSITALPAGPLARKAVASSGASGTSSDGATVRVDADALRRVVSLARKLAGAASSVHRAGAEVGSWQQDIDALFQGLEDLGSAPVSSLFGRIPPLLLRLSGQLNKQFELSVTGAEVRIDRAVLQRLADPLMHLVRNACDHGIEPAAQRLALGKPQAGRIALLATYDGGRIRIVVRDDGAGLSRDKVLLAARKRGITLPVGLDDHAVWQLVFMPGLSTAPTLSQVSGRGVGMDVVQRQVASLGGEVSITSSAGQGVCVTMSIPDGAG